MKYKVGDKVKIREDLIVGNEYGADDFAEEMELYKGGIATITDIYNNKYFIDVDDGEWYWTDEMFEDDAAIKSEDDIKAQTVDIGYHLEYCGHKVIKNVYIDGYDDNGTLYCTDIEETVQYKLPTNSIEFIIPHEA